MTWMLILLLYLSVCWEITNSNTDNVISKPWYLFIITVQRCLIIVSGNRKWIRWGSNIESDQQGFYITALHKHLLCTNKYLSHTRDPKFRLTSSYHHMPKKKATERHSKMSERYLVWHENFFLSPCFHGLCFAPIIRYHQLPGDS